MTTPVSRRRRRIPKPNLLISFLTLGSSAGLSFTYRLRSWLPNLPIIMLAVSIQLPKSLDRIGIGSRTLWNTSSSTLTSRQMPITGQMLMKCLAWLLVTGLTDVNGSGTRSVCSTSSRGYRVRLPLLASHGILKHIESPQTSRTTDSFTVHDLIVIGNLVHPGRFTMPKIQKSIHVGTFNRQSLLLEQRYHSSN